MAKEVVYSHGDIMENYSLYDNYTLEELIKARSKLTSDSKPETLDYLNKLLAKKQKHLWSRFYFLTSELGHFFRDFKIFEIWK